jgi:hypothetical protein
LIKGFKSFELARDLLSSMSRVFAPPDCSHLQGLLEKRRGNHKEALVHYDVALQETDNIWTFLDKAECHVELKEFGSARAILQAIENRWPDDLQIGCSPWYALIQEQLQQASGRVEEAS